MNSIFRKYLLALRVLALLAALLLWAVSVNFSRTGFGIEMPGMTWIGWVMAFVVTIMQLIMNREGFNLNITLLMASILAYTYGIWTNILGIIASQGIVPEGSLVVLPLMLAVILEILPEPLLLWALLGAHSEDLISRLFEDRGGEPSRPAPQSFQTLGKESKPQSFTRFPTKR